MPKWWNKPVTWGDSFKAGGIGLAISALAYGAMIGISAIQSHKEAKKLKEWREAARQQEERTKKEEVKE